MKKMKKQFTVAMVAIMVMSAVLVMPVVSDNGEMNDIQARAINEEMMRFASQKCIGSMNEGELPSVEELRAALGYPTSEQIKATQVSPSKNISSCVYGDITGDSIDDALVHVTYSLGPMGMLSTDIIAVDGKDGTRLWSKSFENCVAVALPVGDLNQDDKNDVIVEVLMCFDPISLSSYAEIIAVNGYNGRDIWSEYEEGGTLEIMLMAGIPANLTSANRTEVVVSTITIPLFGGTATSEITALNVSNGRELWSKSFREGVFGVPVDLTNDGKDEVVIGTPREMAELTEIIGEIFTARNVITVNGNNGTEIWSRHYLDAATFDPAGDLTGDGANDLTVQIGCCELEALRGYDGEELWTMEV